MERHVNFLIFFFFLTEFIKGLVGLGSLGVITHVTLTVEPAFYIHYVDQPLSKRHKLNFFLSNLRMKIELFKRQS